MPHGGMRAGFFMFCRQVPAVFSRGEHTREPNAIPATGRLDSKPRRFVLDYG